MAIDQHYKGPAAYVLNQERAKIISESQNDPYKTLAGIAREKYERFKQTGMPLEDKFLKDVQREGLGFKEDRAAATARNSAIRSLGPTSTTGIQNPNQIVRGLSRRQGAMLPTLVDSTQAGRNMQVNKALNQKIAAVNLGRGIQNKGSQMMINQAAMDIGRQNAYDNARTRSRLAQQEMFGTVAGAGAGAYGEKQGWWGGKN